jgi:hypothetical protein
MNAEKAGFISGGEVGLAGDTDEDTQDLSGVVNDTRVEQRKDFESKNLERLKEMQEKRK